MTSIVLPSLSMIYVIVIISWRIQAIFDFKSKDVIRYPDKEEAAWIVEHCRKGDVAVAAGERAAGDA